LGLFRKGCFQYDDKIKVIFFLLCLWGWGNQDTYEEKPDSRSWIYLLCVWIYHGEHLKKFIIGNIWRIEGRAVNKVNLKPEAQVKVSKRLVMNMSWEFFTLLKRRTSSLKRRWEMWGAILGNFDSVPTVVTNWFENRERHFFSSIRWKDTNRVSILSWDRESLWTWASCYHSRGWKKMRRWHIAW